MKLFGDIEKTIERGFRKWTERVFGPAQADDLVLIERGILEEIEGKVQVVARGKHIFPYNHLTVTLVSPDADKRALYQAAFGEEKRLESEICAALEGADCEVPRGFSVDLETAETGEKAFTIEYGSRAAAQPGAPPALPTARLSVIKGKATAGQYALGRGRTNIGRMAELTDTEQRVVRRNDVVFEESGDEANATVSRKHAHIRLEAGEFRIADDGSEYGTRIFRDGRSIEVPAGNRRGEKLRPGDEIYLGRAALRFDQ